MTHDESHYVDVDGHVNGNFLMASGAIDYDLLAEVVEKARGTKSQSVFGHELGLSQSQISDLENARMRRISGAVLQALQRRFGADLSGAARGLPQLEHSSDEGGLHISELAGLVGKEREELIELLGKVARLWHQGGAIRRQVVAAIDLLDAQHPPSPPPELRRRRATR